jgi:peptidoglycan hydrolase-like protein with peptidoglycan-binding domain
MNVSVLASTNDTKDAPLALSRDHVSVAVGENTAVLIAGTGSFTSKSNNSSIATSSITNDTRVVITGSAVGTATITVCDASKNCEFVSVAVTPAPPAPVTPSIPVPPVQTSTSTSAGTFMFTSYLKPGSSGGEVTALQSMLKLIGYFKGTPNGNYGPQTEGAVKAFQKAKGLAQLGIVGPGTRAALNTLGNSSTATPTPAPAPTTPSSSAYTFTKLIKLGATGIEVTELQKRLTALGFYNGPLNGTFGPLTVAAVKKLQTAHHITPAGYVGPATRAFLN